MNKKELLFSVTASDCEWSYTRGTGAGGQKKNKTSSAVHCIHRPSGGHGYSEASRSQRDNRETAFKKMSESKEFQAWQRLEIARRTGMLLEVEKNVDKQMTEIRIDVKNEDGRWIKESEND